MRAGGSLKIVNEKRNTERREKSEREQEKGKKKIDDELISDKV